MNEKVNNVVLTESTPNNASNDKKSNKKKIILIIGIVLVVIIAIIVGFILLKGNDKKENNNNKSNNNIESNSNKTDEKEQAKNLDIYKIIDTESNKVQYYSFEKEDDTDSELYGTITCKTAECEPGDAFDNYATIEEADGAYLIDIKKNEIVYGPFGIILTDKDDEYDANEKYNITYDYIEKENTLIGVIATKNNKSTLYVAKTGKEFKDLNGEIYEIADLEHNKVIDYGYIILNSLTEDEEALDVVTGSFIYNLSNGKLEGKYNSFIDTFIYNKKPYIMWYNDKKNDYAYTVKDITGKTLFGGKKFEDTNIENSNLVLADNNYFYIYDKSLKLIKQSNKYNDIVMIGKDFVLVDNNHKLDLVDLNDKLLTTFINNYNEDKHFVHTMLSGWYTENKKKGIYIVIEQDGVDINEVLKNNPDNTKEDLDGMNFGYEYYYIPSTKETGKIATYIGGYAKPVLYLYPTKTTNVKVEFKYPELLTTTYPKYNKYWNVTVDKNGTITDKSGRNYYALYWEEASNKKVSFDTGFYVEGKDSINFLEEKLAYIGLTEREANEFIMYWLPILEKNKKSLVYFELTSEREEFNKLLISPKPDSLLRVAVHIKKVDKKVNVKEQHLTKFKRVGFSAVEWGGYLY